MGEWCLAPRSLAPSTLGSITRMLQPIVDGTNGRITMEELLEDHQQRRSDIWFTLEGEVIRSVCITRVKIYSTGLRILLIQFGAGHMEDFYERMGEAEAVARRARCSRLQVSGRPGWKRALEQCGDPGWNEISRTIEKEVI